MRSTQITNVCIQRGQYDSTPHIQLLGCSAVPGYVPGYPGYEGMHPPPRGMLVAGMRLARHGDARDVGDDTTHES